MTDNEIIKTYDACVNGNLKCNECPFLDEVGDGKDCTDISWGYILALINRQKATIERLQGRLADLEVYIEAGEKDDIIFGEAQ